MCYMKAKLDEILETKLKRGREILYLSRKDIEQLGVSIADVIEWIEELFRIKKECELPPKIGIHTRPNSFIHAMPAWVPPLKATGLKWIAGYLNNRERFGLPYLMGVLILNDPESGAPYAIMDCTWPTEMRTAAVSAISAKYLARKDSKVLGIIGLGVQARRHAEAISKVLKIEKIKGYDISKKAAEFFKSWVEKVTGIEVELVDSPEKAVVDCDIVVTAIPITDKPQHVVKPEWIKPGITLLPIDFDAAMGAEIAAKVDKFYTDDLEQYAYYWKHTPYFEGYPPPDKVVGEVAEVVRGEKPGRESDAEIIMANNLGLAIEDMAVGIRLFYVAIEKGIGKKLPLL